MKKTKEQRKKAFIKIVAIFLSLAMILSLVIPFISIFYT